MDRMGKLTNLAHIGIMTNDIEASIAFYVDKLGFTLTSRHELPGTHLAFLNVGTCIIELIGKDAYAPQGDGPVAHVAIECEGIETFVEQLKEKGISFDSHSVNTVPDLLGGISNIFFRGPSGEYLELFEFHNK